MNFSRKPGFAPDVKSLASLLGPGALISIGLWALAIYALAWILGW